MEPVREQCCLTNCLYGTQATPGGERELPPFLCNHFSPSWASQGVTSMAWYCGSRNCPSHSSPEHACNGWQMAALSATVGPNAANTVADVRVIQGTLNRFPAKVGGPATKLATTGHYDATTQTAINQFQHFTFGRGDGRVERGSTTYLALSAGPFQGHWGAVRKDWKEELLRRGVKSTDPIWRTPGSTLGFLALVTKLKNFGVWPFIQTFQSIWQNDPVSNILKTVFIPNNGAKLLAFLQKSPHFHTDAFNLGKDASFRDKSAFNSVHIHVDLPKNYYEVHVDNFNPHHGVTLPWHVVFDWLPAKIKEWIKGKEK